MKRGAWRVLFLVLILALTVDGQTARAKSSSSSSGGKSSSSSSSSSSSKSSGWSNSSSKPSTSTTPAKPGSSTSGWSNSSPQTVKSPPPSAPSPAPGATQKATTSGTWSNSSGASATPGTDSGRAKSSFSSAGQSAIQKEASVKAYNEYKGKFAKPDNPVGQTGSTTTPAPQPSRTWDNYRDYRSYRDNYYAGQGWRAPGYAYQSYPSFGLWDAMFLWFMLRQASGPSFMYNHQNDPGVQSFRQEADKMAASNADLKKQLADLDAKVEQMKKDGVAVDPKKMPEGIDPAVALAAEKVVREDAAKKSGMGSWIWIAGAGLAVAAAFMLLTRSRRKNS